MVRLPLPRQVHSCDQLGLSSDAHPFPATSLVRVGVVRFTLCAFVLGRVGDTAVHESDVSDDAHLDILKSQMRCMQAVPESLEVVPRLVPGLA